MTSKRTGNNIIEHLNLQYNHKAFIECHCILYVSCITHKQMPLQKIKIKNQTSHFYWLKVQWTSSLPPFSTGNCWERLSHTHTHAHTHSHTTPTHCQYANVNLCFHASSIMILWWCRKVWKRVCVKLSGRKTDVRETQGWRHLQGSGSMKRFADLSLVLASQFVLRVSLFSLSHRQRSQPCSYHHYTLHCSRECGMHIAAWQQSVGQSVSRCTWSCRKC